jgi:hypothetical protein
MGKPSVYGPVKSPTDSSVVKGNGSSIGSGKFKARYPHPPLGIGQSNGSAGKGGPKALTPGTTPTGS